MKVVTAEQMIRIDRSCIESGIPVSVLMENAGKGIAENIRRIKGDITGKRIVILAGPGNNGGDGLVAARYLSDWQAKVSLFLFGKKRENDQNLERVYERNIDCFEVNDEVELENLGKKTETADILIDSLFGTGSNRPLGGIYQAALKKAGSIINNRENIHVFAVDLPSGLNADTGDVDDTCLYADDTLTLAAPKVGLFNYPGSERAGRITVVDIGIPERLFSDIRIELNTAVRVKTLLPGRPLSANKGTFGKVLVIAGSTNFIGAAYLACSGAVRTGAGLVTLATPASLLPILATKMAEVTYLPLPESEPGMVSPESVRVILDEIEKYDVLLIGCGLGQSASVKDFIRTLLLKNSATLPVTVIDADALNTLSEVPEWWHQITGNVILTPHPGEMSRLTGITVEKVQRNRLQIALDSSERWNQTVVLKGAYSIIASPGAAPLINLAANPGLASAGTGDVLAGVIAGFAAQNIEPAEAASCGVYIHSEAGELVKEKMGDTGMTASDLLPLLPLAIKKIKIT